jgi:putative endonuclease
MLVYYEVFQYINDAIKRETILKTWKRKWKLELIEEKNKEWKDLFFEIFNEQQITAMKNYLMANSGKIT